MRKGNIAVWWDSLAKQYRVYKYYYLYYGHEEEYEFFPDKNLAQKKGTEMYIPLYCFDPEWDEHKITIAHTLRGEWNLFDLDIHMEQFIMLSDQELKDFRDLLKEFNPDEYSNN